MKAKFTLLPLLAAFFSLQVYAQVPPEGATCDDAIEVTCGNIYSGSTQNVPNDNATSGATTCNSTVGQNGQIWYSYSDGGGNLISLSTCGTTTFDTKIHVYAGPCGALTCVASNDDACSMQSSVSFVTETSVTYLIRVGGFANAFGSFGLTVGCGTNTGGCTDPLASNYNAEASFNDGSCLYEGCTDPAAINFDGNANTDDGSCEYCNGEGSVVGQLYVCTFSNGGDVTLTITDATGNVVTTVSGLGNNQIEYIDLCLQSGVCYTATMSNASGAQGWSNGYFWVNANNVQVVNESLNANQTVETTIFSIDGTCTAITGCMDPAAANYNANANYDDGSCVYAPTCEDGTMLTLSMTFGSFANEVSYQITDASGAVVFTSAPYQNQSGSIEFVCLPNGCYTVVMQDSFGDGWNGGYLNIYGNGAVTAYTLQTGSISVGVLSVNAEGCEPNVSSGCTNPTADNYNSTAVIDDGSCVFSGCTDQTALNFDYNATVDDGSCEYCNGEGSAIANLYICTFSNGNQVELQIVDSQGNEVYYAYGLNNSAIVNTQLCLVPGECYTANMINNVGPLGWYNGYFWININGIQILNTSLPSTEQYASVQFSIDGTCGPSYGCTDPTALNYNAEATMDNGTCLYPVFGCMDSTALNYNPYATTDDGTCLYAEDCDFNMVSFEFNPGTFLNEGSYQVVDANGVVVASGTGTAAGVQYACLPDGCYTINMFDTFGDGWDGSGYLSVYSGNANLGFFTFPSGFSANAGFGINAEGCVPAVPGCTDPAALNYNPAANEDDGSCTYPETCDGNFVYISISTQNWGSEVSWNLVGADGVVYASGSGYSSWNSYTTYACVPDGCYEMQMTDSWGDGWNGAYYWITANNSYFDGTLLYGTSATDMIGINSDCGMTPGCTDPAAMNYDAAANYDDGSCMYNDGSIPGVGYGLEMDFTMYPNPVNAGLVMNLNDLDENSDITVSILSVDGKQVANNFFGNSDKSRMLNLNVSELAAGYYFVRIENGSNNKVLPLIKE